MTLCTWSQAQDEERSRLFALPFDTGNIGFTVFAQDAPYNHKVIKTMLFIF